MTDAKGPILIVEDETVLAELYAKWCEYLGYDSVHAGDGKEALWILEHEKPIMMIVDLNMPGMGGVEFIRNVREKDFGTPILVVSALIVENIKQELFDLGVNEYYPKPLHFDQLTGMIDKSLSAS